MPTQRYAAILLLGLLGCSTPKEVAASTAPSHPPALVAPLAKAGSPSATLLFVGDLALVGPIFIRLERQKGPIIFPFEAVADRLRSADITVGNLECVPSPIGHPVPGIFPLRAPVAALTVLENAGFDVLSIANNHARDLGAEGRDDMIRRLHKTKLAVIGEDDAMPQAPVPVVREVNGIRVGFIAYYNIDQKRACRETTQAKQGLDILVVFNHWGFEGTSEILEDQRRLGHAMIDSGADIVVGAHAHVVQADEWYKEGYIAYGLGNFVFPGMSQIENQGIGAAVEVRVNRSGLVDRTIRRVRLNATGIPTWINETPSLQVKPTEAAPIVQ